MPFSAAARLSELGRGEVNMLREAGLQINCEPLPGLALRDWPTQQQTSQALSFPITR